MSQCGIFRIFLSFRFYVKSILESLGVLRYVILTHFGALKFDFYEFVHFLKAEIAQIAEIPSPKNGQNRGFKAFRFSKIGFT